MVGGCPQTARAVLPKQCNKRLWHRGFKGRFAAFHWDTWWFDNWQWVDDMGGQAIAAALAHYNDSEQTAWTSGASLKRFVDALPFQNKHLTAHSMGNIVASEAMRLGMHVTNYVLMQAAVPAACYDEAEYVRQTLQYQHYGITMWESASPDDDPDPVTRALAYRGRFQNLNGNIISFFLPQDYATYIPWEINNDQTKPPSGLLVTNFGYARNAASGEKLYKFTGAAFDHYITEPYESMPYASRSWGKAAGAFGPTETTIGTQGSIDESIDLSSSAYQLPGENSGFGDEHSGQFNARIQHLQPFYDRLINTLGIGPPNP